MAKYPYEIVMEDIVIKYSFPSDLPEIVYALLSIAKELNVNWACLKASLEKQDGEYGGIKVIRRRPKGCKHEWQFKHEGEEQCDLCGDIRDIPAGECQLGGDNQDCGSCANWDHCPDSTVKE